MYALWKRYHNTCWDIAGGESNNILEELNIGNIDIDEIDNTLPLNACRNEFIEDEQRHVSVGRERTLSNLYDDV